MTSTIRAPRRRSARAAAAVSLAAALAALSGAAQPAADEPRELEDTPIMKYENPKSWDVMMRVTLTPGHAIDTLTTTGTSLGVNSTETTQRSETETFIIGVPEDGRAGFEFVLPIVAESANTITPWEENGSGLFRVNNQQVEAETTVKYAQGTRAPYLSLRVPGEVECLSFTAEVHWTVTAYETLFDQQAAWDIPWPDSWSPEARVWLARDAMFDADHPTQGDTVAKLVENWTNGNDPRQIPPVQLAKFMTAMVLDHMRVVGPPAESPVAVHALNATGGTYRLNTRTPRNAIGGFIVGNTADSAVEGTGSEHDISMLLTAVLRRVGIPARTVIGIDDTESGLDEVRSWVEFAVESDTLDRTVWIPIDTEELESGGRNARNWQQKWEHFGSADEFRERIPIAYYFHPPAPYRAYNRPGLFGVTSDTGLPNYAVQSLDFELDSTPNRPGRSRR